MNTTEVASPAPRSRRKHAPEFKAQVIAACLQPGVSIAAVALANQLNANLLRNWVKAYRARKESGLAGNIGIERRSPSVSSAPGALIPVTVQVADVPPSGDIQIEIRRQQTVFQITWPTSQATACAQWLREVLR